ncbi:hypothetical protein ACIA5C_30145 [Actinoplanes sp. NPDC051343]|uniref:hypothetical protein n=1 Tax=Actinoplanes sp. NPDC051343 TaxID=3363906 RepID=UPI0037A2A496
MTDQELLTSIAVTLATKTAEGLAAGGRAAFDALVRLVRRRLERPGSVLELPEAGADASNATSIDIVRQQLANAAAHDPEFEAQLSELWRNLLPHLEARDGGVINTVAGNVEGNAVQARDVHGGISFGSPGRSDH